MLDTAGNDLQRGIQETSWSSLTQNLPSGEKEVGRFFFPTQLLPNSQYKQLTYFRERQREREGEEQYFIFQ